MKTILVDVASEASAAQIAAELQEASDCNEPTEVVLRVRALRGARKIVARLFGGGDGPSRAARGSALVARGYREITGEIDADGDDRVRGNS